MTNLKETWGKMSKPQKIGAVVALGIILYLIFKPKSAAAAIPATGTPQTITPTQPPATPVVVAPVITPDNTADYANWVDLTQPVTSAAAPTPVITPPTLSVVQNPNQTDNYTINFGNGIYYYTKGSTPVNNQLDSTWTVRAETAQDGSNQVLITVYQNGNTVYSQLFQ